MKIIAILIAICVLDSGMSLVTSYNKPVVIPTTQPLSTLAQDLHEISRLIPSKLIHQLVIRYLLNDAQFQTFVRIINSNDAYLTRMRFHSQPEVMSFTSWVRSQIMLSGIGIVSAESNESLEIINRTPLWSQVVNGWQGFVNEFCLYYPEDVIRSLVQTKAAQSGIFAEFIKRLKALKPVYDRVMALPEAQRVIENLKANGINTVAIDTFIRNQFGWQKSAAVASG